MSHVLDAEQSAEGTPSGSSAPDAQALIREARSRQRKRRIGIGVALALLAAVAIYFGVGGFSSGGTPRTTPSSPFGPSGPTVARAGLARVTFTFRDTRQGGCIPASNTTVTTGTGSIDLKNNAVAYVERTIGCGQKPHVQANRWLGTTLYTAFQGPTLHLPWKRVPNAGYGLNNVQGLMTSPWALTIADLPGTVLNTAGPNAVNGKPATKYVGTTTLLAVQNELRKVFGPHAVSLPTAGLGITETYVPDPSVIPISLAVWRDSQGQILQITAIEPLYTGIYADGSDTENAEEVPTISAIENGVSGPGQPPATVQYLHLKTLRQQGAFEMTLTMSSYGLAPAVSVP
jgi:hypothetical protein